MPCIMSGFETDNEVTAGLTDFGIKGSCPNSQATLTVSGDDQTLGSVPFGNACLSWTAEEPV